MNAYSEDPATIGLYPEELYEEDLTPDMGEEIEEVCNEIRSACKGWGTNEKRLIEAIGSTTGEDRMKIAIKYQDMFEKDLIDVMEGECGDGNLGLALQFLARSPVAAECAMIKKACDGLGTNEKLLYTILSGRSNEDMELLKKTFYKLYTEDLTSLVVSESGGSLKKVVVASLQAAEEEWDPDYHTEEKAAEDSETIYEAGQGRFGSDPEELIKTIVMSPPKHLKMVNFQYADKYGYTLLKALEEELGGDGESAALFTLSMKLKPYETLAKLIKSACAGFGTDELLLTCCIIRYQDLLPHVCIAHEDLFEKSVQQRVKDECRGDYERLLLALVNKVSPEE
mmetsp:Transcript_493/g.665  ORF Transcript_493/g.665 Transcript_493/m.665 type:complete len:340 (-) Transcript_493:311-1330(-)|eukprot:CAMPEP_0197247486 /NCGR_PEP_ID=MMETSP1429-20130617/29222_1 /TAXON_ID=49237 /ORGANISM="Chaetoceros  sp., Strain UNC1202" /LENGTH=339 /DNA_ID=CAMNT_0042708403 /DNA_START=64 /DNA_END=1083 /DNA_ORIENTATION=+